MQTDFYILCAVTVPENYTWDLGTPLVSFPTTRSSFTTIFYASGFAPALNVVFANNSVSDSDFNFIDYVWDFGDYYNDDNNSVSLSCVSLVQHTYVMPGKYTVSLRHVQSRGREELDQTGNSLTCRGKYGFRWFWDETGQRNVITQALNPNATTWSETECLSSKAKWWDSETACLQKYCKAWSWYDLGTDRSNPVRWTETETDAVFQKKWTYEANDTVCNVSNATFLTTTETQEQNIIKQYIVEVKELPPVANMFSVFGDTGVSPYTVQLSPKNCKPGSFPIDRIDWDFGDGSPIKTVTRYAPPSGQDIVNTGFFIGDPADVRNYDVVHTYVRDRKTYPVFYPSLTCYSSSTSTSDSCCITLGPITLPTTPTDLHLLKVRNTLKGNVYAFTENNNIALVTTTPIATSIVTQPTLPPVVIRNSKRTQQSFTGYLNFNEFPARYVPDCNFRAITIPTNYIIVEDPTEYGALSSEEVPIKTETDFFIIP